MKNISKPSLLQLTFPLPPPADQRALIKALNARRTEAAHLRTEAAAVRATASIAFEAAIYAAETEVTATAALMGAGAPV
jgi:type I restriction enzyme S subunit